MTERPNAYLASGVIRAANCPACHCALAGYIGISTSAERLPVPKEGSLTACAGCGTVLAFQAPSGPWRTWTFRRATDSEIAAIAAHPIGQAMIELAKSKRAKPS